MKLVSLMLSLACMLGGALSEAQAVFKAEQNLAPCEVAPGKVFVRSRDRQLWCFEGDAGRKMDACTSAEIRHHDGAIFYGVGNSVFRLDPAKNESAEFVSTKSRVRDFRWRGADQLVIASIDGVRTFRVEQGRCRLIAEAFYSLKMNVGPVWLSEFDEEGGCAVARFWSVMKVNPDGTKGWEVAGRLNPTAAPVVADGRIFTSWRLGDVMCHDSTSGELLWKKEYPHSMFGGMKSLTKDLLLVGSGDRTRLVSPSTGTTVADLGEYSGCRGGPFAMGGGEFWYITTLHRVVRVSANERSGREFSTLTSKPSGIARTADGGACVVTEGAGVVDLR